MKKATQLTAGFRDLSENLWNTLSSLRTASYPTAYTYSIDCDTLPDFNIGAGVFEDKQFKPFFTRLGTLTHPALYWFEITSDHTGENVYNMMRSYRESADRKNFPALKKRVDFNSRVVYVGKIKKRTDGRMFVHLGYYPVVGTAGLQLAHWAVGTGLKLDLHIIELPLSKETENLSALFEHKLASMLKPLAGKHNL